MPDAFESAYPLSPTLNPEDIRARANSSSKTKRPVITFLAGNESVEIPDKSEVGIMRPLRKSEYELDSFAEPVMIEALPSSAWLDKRDLQYRFV